jgi:CysZ protein
MTIITQFFKEFWLGLKSYWDALRFIRDYRLYWYFLIPAVLMLVIYYLGNRIMNLSIDADLSNMNGIVWYFIQVTINISIAILLMKFAKYVVVIVLSPLLSHLSQRCEKIITGNTYPIDYKQILLDVRRGIRLAIRNLLWEYFFFLIILLISYIGWNEPTKSPVFYLTFIIGFYYYGFSFIDYDNERRKLDEQTSIAFVRSHRGLAMGIGMIYSLLILVPVKLDILFSISDPENLTFYGVMVFLGHLLLWIFASIAPIVAIVSASIALEEMRSATPETTIN